MTKTTKGPAPAATSQPGASASPSQVGDGPTSPRPTWAPDYEIPLELASALIHAQFPQLAGATVSLVAEGWDNAMFRVDAPAGGSSAGPDPIMSPPWVFRFPRREVALATLAREIAVLPTLAGLLPLPIPRPILIGASTPSHPRPFWGGPLLPGVELLEAYPRDPIGVAAALGGFLRVLHGPDVLARLTAAAPDAPSSIPADPNNRADAASVAQRGRERLGAIEADASLRGQASALLDRAADLPAPTLRPVLSHGDLHLRHVLLDRDEIGGVIDWGDLCRTDRSVDLSIAFGAFAGDARAALLDAYGGVEARTALRARAVAAFLCAALAHHAQDSGSARMSAAALAGLARAVT